MKLLFGILALSFLLLGVNSCSESATAKEELSSASFEISGMTCSMGCAQSIQDKLNETEGVLGAKVVFEKNTCNLTYSSKKLSEKDIVSIVEGMGGGDKYQVSQFKKEAKSSSSQSPDAIGNSGSINNSKEVVFKPITFPNVFDAFLRRI